MLTQWLQRDNPNDCSYKKAIFIHAKEGPIKQPREDSVSSEVYKQRLEDGELGCKAQSCSGTSLPPLTVLSSHPSWYPVLSKYILST